MAQKITLKCDTCEKKFELSVGHLKSTVGVIPDEEILKRDGEKAAAFVDEISDHRCSGRVCLEFTTLLD